MTQSNGLARIVLVTCAVVIATGGCSTDVSGSLGAEQACVKAAVGLAGGSTNATPQAINLDQNQDGSWSGGGTLAVLDGNRSPRAQPYSCNATREGDEFVARIQGINPGYQP